MKKEVTWKWQIKLLLSLIAVYGTYNTFNISIYNFMINMNPNNLFNYSWILFYLGFLSVIFYGINHNLGKKGFLGLLLILGTFLGGIFQFEILQANQAVIINSIQIIFVVVFFIGLMWPSIKRKIFGVTVVSENENDEK